MGDQVCDRFPTGPEPWNEDDERTCAHCGCELEDDDYDLVNGAPWCWDCIYEKYDEDKA
jgi:hypothetical protein